MSQAVSLTVVVAERSLWVPISWGMWNVVTGSVLNPPSVFATCSKPFLVAPISSPHIFGCLA